MLTLTAHTACRTAREASSAEYILVDDGSTDDVGIALDTGRRLQRLFGVRFRHMRNRDALGYGPANNAGVKLATAKYVALINSDTHVINGWLRPLVETIRSRSNVGMVIISPDICEAFCQWASPCSVSCMNGERSAMSNTKLAAVLTHSVQSCTNRAFAYCKIYWDPLQAT